MADSIFTTIRKALQTNASPALTAAQVILGNYELAAGTNFFGTLGSTPWLFIQSTSGEAGAFDFNGEFEIEAYMFNSIPKDASYDWTARDDIVASLVKAWVTYSKWVAAGNTEPFKVLWSKPEIRSDLAPNVVQTKFTFPCRFISDQGI